MNAGSSGPAPARSERPSFVTGVAFDSRTSKPGHVFVALKGVHADGAAFAHQAIERGALAVVSEQPPPSDA